MKSFGKTKYFNKPRQDKETIINTSLNKVFFQQ